MLEGSKNWRSLRDDRRNAKKAQKTPSNRRNAKKTAINCGSLDPLKTSTISSMICGTGIHDQLPDFFHDLWHWNPRSAPSTCQRACPTCPRTATAEHHSFLHVWTTSKPAQQGHRPPCRKNCTTTGVSTTLSKNWTNPSDDLHNRVIDHLHKLQLRDGKGHVSNLVQELHGLPRTATASNPKQRARRQPCPRTARRHPPPPLTPVPSWNPLWGSRAPP